MNYLLSITVLFGITSIVLCQRFLYGNERQTHQQSDFGGGYRTGNRPQFRCNGRNCPPVPPPEPLEAICLLQGKASGTVRFSQNGPDVTIRGVIEGLTPGSHGFHVHQYGDLSQGCTSAGGHFNPYGKTHGSPADHQRHVGDLGNLEAGADGKALVDFPDRMLSLKPGATNNIIGRGLVVHEKVDDLGQGGDEGSRTTGNAGGRVACCTIAVAQGKAN